MPAPFYNAIKGITAGTPGTGAFTPSASSTGFRAWSLVPTGWIGLVRYEDGTAWELCYSYWDGTTLSRASTQVYDSSTGSQLTLTSAATAALMIDANAVMWNLGLTRAFAWVAAQGTSSVNLIGSAAIAVTGTATAKTMATTNLLAAFPAAIFTSVTTANGQAGLPGTTVLAMPSTVAGVGGYAWTARFGAATLPTGPRLFAGTTSTTFVASTAEPSTLTAHVAIFGKDSTDTNIQLMTNSNAGACTKVDTGITLAANGVYQCLIYSEPGSTKVYALLVRLDTGAIWFSSTTTDVPADGAQLMPQLIGGLNGTNTGTAFVMHFGSMSLSSGM